MSFLQENYSEYIAARITSKGRKMIAKGDFNIRYFQVGDSEFDYNFSDFDGATTPAQRVLMPFDKDSQVKYPYKISSSILTGTTYGTPIESSFVETIKNYMGSAGNVSGTTVTCVYDQVSITNINGTSELNVPDGSLFTSASTGLTFITIMFDILTANAITKGSTCLIYGITNIISNTLYLDRLMPDLSMLAPANVTVILNYCDPAPDVPEDQQDPWVLNNIWGAKPAGLDYSTEDERLSGYTSNVFVSTKEYFGYNTCSGQTSNTGTTIVNSFGDVIIVPPEEQHSLSLIHYSKSYDNLSDFDLIFKYDDYIDHTTDGSDYFEVYIPFMSYERNTGTTIGAKFFMDTTDYYINSTASDTRINQMKFRYLLDENNIRVGKIFVNHKVIVFDDQEIVAILEYKSNRRFTLPIPRISMTPIDTQCGGCGDINNPLLGGTGDTVFISYLLQYTGSTYPQLSGLTGMHCNHYLKIVGTVATGDVSIKFNTDDFKFMTSTIGTTGYTANKFYVLAQKVVTGSQPDPTNWKIMDFTDQIPGHTPGNNINPVNLRGAKFIINSFDYELYSSTYNLETYLGLLPDEPSTSPEFGDEQPFAGGIKLTRATDLEVMQYFINLPSGYFETTQNPSYTSGKDKRITEVTLLDSNKEVLVIAKPSSPIKRIGTQVLSVKIDI